MSIASTTGSSRMWPCRALLRVASVVMPGRGPAMGPSGPGAGAGGRLGLWRGLASSRRLVVELEGRKEVALGGSAVQCSAEMPRSSPGCG